MKYRNFIMFTLSVFILSACSATKTLMQPKLPEENGLGLSQEDVSAGTEEAQNLDGRVTVVVHVDHQGFALVKNAALHTLLTSKLIGDLNEVGVDDVNRKAEKNLFEELKLNLLKGGRYDGPAVSNYAVLATFLESTFDVSYDKPLRIPFMDDDAEYKKKPGTCKYRVTVHIGVKVLDLYDSARTVKSINVKETEKNSFETRNQNCPVPKTEQHALARRAAESAADCLTLPLQQFLSPRGRITASRRDEKGRTFFRISTGKSGGIKPADAIKIYSRNSTDDQALIAEGQVHKEIGAKHAWVIVSDEAAASVVKLGDVAKVNYENKLVQSRDWVECRSIRTES